MAFTTPVWPMEPYSMSGGSQSAMPMSFPITSAKPITKGDVITMTSGKVLDGNTQQAASVIVGIAAEPKASIASALDSDMLLVHVALPGRLFVGNMTDGVATDSIDPAYADIAPATLYDTAETTIGTFAVINFPDTTSGQIKVVKFADEQANGKRFISGTGGTINPRVIFHFASTIFMTSQV